MTATTSALVHFRTVLARHIRDLERSYMITEIAGLYWHFVDLVWIMVFTFVYLL